MDQPWVGKRVFVIDDSYYVRKEICDIYHEIGMEVVGESSVAGQAMEEIFSIKPDLISIDIILPDMHGIELYYRLQKQFGGVKMLLLSCLNQDHIIGNVFSEKIPKYAFVGKPLNLDQLKFSLQKIFSIESDHQTKIKTSSTKPNKKEKTA